MASWHTHTHAGDLFELYKWRRHNQRRERTSLDPKKHHRTWLESCSVRVLQRQTNELVNFQLGCYYSSRLCGVRCVYKVQKRDQTSVENSEWGKLSSKAVSRKISWSRGEREKKLFLSHIPIKQKWFHRNELPKRITSISHLMRILLLHILAHIYTYVHLYG